MASVSTADHSVSPPKIGIPRQYNAAYDLIQRNAVAFARMPAWLEVDDGRSLHFAEVKKAVDGWIRAKFEFEISNLRSVFTGKWLLGRSSTGMPTKPRRASCCSAECISARPQKSAGEESKLL